MQLRFVIIFYRRMRKNTTWQILQEDQYNSILRWSVEGTSFEILNEQGLCSEVLPKYFKHSNFSSFIRQLNMYNFHKKKVSDNTMEFYHKLFRKNKKQLLIGIKRKPSQAEIEYGDQLIRKMIKDTTNSNSKPHSRESSHHSDQNFDINHVNNISQLKSTSYQQSYSQAQSQMVFYQYWPNMNPPLIQSNRENLSNYNFQTKIITNIIIKNPPETLFQTGNFYNNF